MNDNGSNVIKFKSSNYTYSDAIEEVERAGQDGDVESLLVAWTDKDGIVKVRWSNQTLSNLVYKEKCISLEVNGEMTEQWEAER